MMKVTKEDLKREQERIKQELATERQRLARIESASRCLGNAIQLLSRPTATKGTAQ